MKRTTLVQHVRQQERMNPGATGEFTSLMNEIMVASKIVSLEVNKAGIGEDILGLTGKINVQGEEVQKLDEFADMTFTKIIGQSETVCAITSEELEYPVIIPPDRNPGKYIFMMDPLDGSSNIDVNVGIGTIFSIYKKKTPGDQVADEDLLQKGDQQIAAGYVIYGSSTMFVYTSGQGVHVFSFPSKYHHTRAGFHLQHQRGQYGNLVRGAKKSHQLSQRKRRRYQKTLQTTIHWHPGFRFSPDPTQGRDFHVPQGHQ
jgi:fructose-1,6-bisphosphatase I